MRDNNDKPDVKEYSDVDMQMLVTEYGEYYKKKFNRDCEYKDAALDQESMGGYPGKVRGISRLMLGFSALPKLVPRYAICPGQTFINCVALTNSKEWNHLALIKVRETPFDAPPLYPTVLEEEQMRHDIRWFFATANNRYNILHNNKIDTGILHASGGIHPLLFVSAGYMHVQQDVAISGGLKATAYLIDYWYDYGGQGSKGEKFVLEMHKFYNKLGSAFLASFL